MRKHFSNYIVIMIVLLMVICCSPVPKQLTYESLPALNPKAKYPIKVGVTDFTVVPTGGRVLGGLYDEPLGRAFAKRFTKDLNNSKIFNEVLYLGKDFGELKPEEILRKHSIRYVFTGNIENFNRTVLPHWIGFMPPIFVASIGCAIGVPACSYLYKSQIAVNIKIADLESGVNSFNKRFKYTDPTWQTVWFKASWSVQKREDRRMQTPSTRKAIAVILRELNTENIFAGPTEASAPVRVTRRGTDIKRKYDSIILPTHSGEKAYVAVMDLRGASGQQTESIAKSLSDPLRVELQGTGYFRVCDRANIETVMAEIGFQQTGCTSSECVVQVGRVLGVEKIISGSISKLGDTYIISLQIIDVATALVERSVSEKAACTEGDLVYLMGIAAKKLCLKR